MKPASCALPFLGIDAVVLDPIQGTVLSGATQGVLAFRKPWPGMARTCLSDHERYVSTYLQPYPGYHFSGDSVYRDNDGFYFVKGRVDDVLNVSGHRIGNAEIEAALQADPAVAQAAVVGKPHPIKGSSICAFCMLAVGYEETPQLVSQLRLSVRTEIGGFAAPDMVCITPNLPMTRSGKIMRRILRKIVAGEANDLGDVSTLSDPRVINTIIEIVAKNQEAGRAHVRSISSP
jgi:acetyl-CoA synthetase